MAEADRSKWDARYASGDFMIEKGLPSPILERHIKAVNPGRALDVAAGMGRNSLHLARHGFEVDALDISPVGLAHLEAAARAEGLGARIHARAVDLEGYEPGTDEYDLILMANYLDRPLIAKLGRALKPGGILLIDTFLDDPASLARAMNPEHLLRRGELVEIFAEGFEILEDREYPKICMDGTTRTKQAFAVRRAG